MNDKNVSPYETWVGSGTVRYTHGHADAVLRSHRWRTAENSAAYLLPHLTPGMSLLDVGCGPGTLTADLARRVAPGPVVGVDLSADVVNEARTHTDEQGLDNVTYVDGDFREVQPPAGGFDVVHAHQVLQHLGDPVQALSDMAAMTSDGGIVAARDADYPAMTWWPAEPLLDRWLDIYLAVTARNGAEAAAGRRLKTWALAAGLENVEYTTSTWTYSSPDDLRWWTDLWADRVTSTRLGDQAVEYGLSTREELAAIGLAWRDWATRPGAIFVVVHGEVIGTPGR